MKEPVPIPIPRFFTDHVLASLEEVLLGDDLTDDEYLARLLPVCRDVFEDFTKTPEERAGMRELPAKRDYSPEGLAHGSSAWTPPTRN